jgi:3-dehydrosphinganine reductase
LNNYFTNKLAFITGGSLGIGFSIAKAMVLSGANVWIFARRESILAASEAELSKYRLNSKQTIRSTCADVSNENQITEVLSKLIREVGSPDYLFNCAGVTRPGRFEELETEIFRQMIEINYLGTVYPTKIVIPGMIAKRNGHIVNFSSVTGYSGVYGYSAYGASKFAVKGFSDILRSEMRLQGVKVSIVFPADTQTPQLDGEKQFQPPILKEMNHDVPSSPDKVAKIVLSNVQKGKYIITPGFDATFYYLMHLYSGNLEYTILDILVSQAQKRVNAAVLKHS